MIRAAAALFAFLLASTRSADAQLVPTVVDANLQVRQVNVSALTQPVGMAFLGANDFFVIEKASGRVHRMVNGVITATPLDLAVNSNSERGLLGITLHPNFASNGFVYLFWTESSTGADSTVANEVGNAASAFAPGTPSPFGHRVDRFIWNPTNQTLTYDRQLIRLRALQTDAGQPSRGNHNGGVIRFGPDGKIYIIMGDQGRRGQYQNLPNGPTLFAAPVADDQFGGPAPDNAHLSSMILRLNDDGTTPTDNPFVAAGAAIGGEAGANIQRTFGYGVRNSFGMAFDPVSGVLWTQENCDDAFDEINRVLPGFNGGWIQSMGPISRQAQFKVIETTMFGGATQQLRWPPIRFPYTPALAQSRMFNLLGSTYTDPQLSWKFAIAPAGIGFMNGNGLGSQYNGDLFVGAARLNLLSGYLLRLRLSNDRSSLSFTDALLNDKVADNLGKFDVTESESLVFGANFGVGTDVHTGPGGTLFVVSLSTAANPATGAIYEVLPR